MSKDNIKSILKMRGSRYGDLAENSRISQSIKSRMRSSNNWQELPAHMQESLDMIASKVSRVLTGNYNYDDNWIDIIGYSKLVLERLDKEEVNDRNGRVSFPGSGTIVPGYYAD